MREIVLDTETTGLDPAEGHRIVEIGCVELLNTIPTGAFFHTYINPGRDMPEEAFRVHGLSAEFLAGHPSFASIAADFMKFTGEARIVAHNAEFDLRFLNAELALLGMELITKERVVDTLALARRRFPGGPNNLDALCARFGIDTSRRTRHGALLDAEILAEVYAELLGGRQAALMLDEAGTSQTARGGSLLLKRPHPLPSRLKGEDLESHRAFVSGLGTAPLWNIYFGSGGATAPGGGSGNVI
ncbi:MAG TPA: DNA polymerase III subunit epsilon [Methylocella sp.]|nr:DNA polymerase III subunit epsilon [Methylocella sp.]